MRKELCVILALVLLLFPAVTMAQPEPTSSIVISASRTEIPADDVSTSAIKVVVSWPEESNITGPAVNTLVDMSTNLGRLTDAGNESNSGSSISLITDTNGTVTALLSGNETGDAEITVTTLWGYNTTPVTFLAPEATTTAPPSGDGDGGNGGAVTTPTPAAAVNETPTPSPEATATPALTPAETPMATPTPSPSPTKEPLIPGFEAVFTIASLLAVTYLVLRRKR